MVNRHPDSVVVTEEEDPKSYRAIDLSTQDEPARVAHKRVNVTLDETVKLKAHARQRIGFTSDKAKNPYPKSTLLLTNAGAECLKFLKEHGPSDLRTLCGPFKFGTLRALARRGLIRWEQGPGKEFLWRLP